MLSTLRIVVVLAVAYWLQVGPLSFLTPDGVGVPLVATTVVVLAMAVGHRRALPYAFLAGLAVDAAAGRAIGLHALLYLLLAEAAGFTTRRFYTDEPWLALFFTAVAVLVERGLAGAFLILSGVHVAHLLPAVLLGAAYSLPVALLARRAFATKEHAYPL